ncbi:MAG: glycosyltransferase family 39 protein [Blastocatellia bacterium]|nr:glycosyltransferase family 39 protein [Blastocatellia bacterium]
MRPRAKLLCALLIFAISYTTKSLQAADLAPVMYTDEQPFYGLTDTYDLRARSILEGEGLLGPYDINPSRTVWLAQAPGYSIYLGGVYSLVGRDFFKVQLVQNAINSISPILMFLIVGSLLSWRVGVASGVLAAISHHLSHISNFILPDSLSALPILSAVYFLIMARRYDRGSYWLYALAGAMTGIASWLRPQVMLLALFMLVMLVMISRRRWPMARRAALMTAVSIIVIAPITIKNYLVYGEFVPITIGAGIVLWEGIGESNRGAEFGAVAKDHEVAAQEAILYNEPRYSGTWSSPDGIQRDRDRIKKSLDIIVRHPVWYAGVMLGRMKDMVKYSAHAPLISRKAPSRKEDFFPQQAAPRRREWESIGFDPSSLAFTRSINWMRPLARTFQRIAKESMQLFMLIGSVILFVAAPRRAALIFLVPLYYFLFQSFFHTEFRYTLPMQYFLFVFAATTWVLIVSWLWTSAKRLYKRRKNNRSKADESEKIV